MDVHGEEIQQFSVLENELPTIRQVARRSRPAVLVQPNQWPELEQEKRDLIDAAWPDVEAANEAGPVYGRLIKELVVVVKQSKPMARAGGKDTVQRRRSLQLYQDEIDEAYRPAEELGLLYGEIAERSQLNKFQPFMYKFLPAIEDLSVCLRCRYRLAIGTRPRRLREQHPFQQQHGAFSSVPTRRQEAAPQQLAKPGDTNYVHYSPITYEPHDGFIITYEPSDPPTPAQRHARRHSLGLDVLGKPAEILVLQQDQVARQRDIFYTEEPDSDPKDNVPLSSAELTDAVTKERGIISDDQVILNIEQLRNDTLREEHRRDIIGDLAYDQLTTNLRNGFTVKQLQAYLDHTNQTPEADPADLRQDYASPLCSRSSWREGYTSISEQRAPKLLEHKSLAKTSRSGRVVLRKGGSKEDLVHYIVRKYWQLKPARDGDAQGEIDIRFLPAHFDLILNHRKDIIKRTSESYGVKIDVSRREKIIRITSDSEACRDLYQLFEYMIGSIRNDTISVTVTDAQQSQKLARTAIIYQTAKITSTVIEEVEISRFESSVISKLVVHYLGPDTTDLDDVKRTLSSIVKSTDSINRKSVCATTTKSHPIVASPIDIGAALPIKDRHIRWSRLGVPIAGHRNVLDSPSDRGVLLQDSIVREIVQFLKSRNAGDLPHHPTSAPSHWSSTPTSTSSVTLGRLILPIASTPSILKTLHQRNPVLPKARREFLTTIPGLFRALNRIPHLTPLVAQEGSLLITLSSNEAHLPILELILTLAGPSQTPQLTSARLLLPSADLDVFLPNNITDARLSRRAYINGDANGFDPAVLDFIGASALDVEGRERLTTPSNLTLRVPRYALARSPPAESDAGSDDSEEIDFSFQSLEHRSSIIAPYGEGLKIRYHVIEAGRVGGRREELSISTADEGVVGEDSARKLCSAAGWLIRACEEIGHESGMTVK